MEVKALYVLGVFVIFALGAVVGWHVRDRRQRMVLDWIDGRLAHINRSGHPEIIQRERDVSRETKTNDPYAGLSVKMNLPDTPEFRERFERDTINKVNRALYGGSNAK